MTTLPLIVSSISIECHFLSPPPIIPCNISLPKHTTLNLPSFVKTIKAKHNQPLQPQNIPIFEYQTTTKINQPN